MKLSDTKITVCQHANESFKDVLSLVSDNNRKYCEKFETDYITSSENFLPSTIIHFNSIFYQRYFLLQKLMKENPSTEWFFYLDADAIFINHNIDLRIFPLLSSDNAFFIACSADEKRKFNSYWNINTGIFFVKNSVEGRKFIDWVVGFCLHCSGRIVDQPFIQNSIKENPLMADDFSYFPNTAFNHNGKFIYHACEKSSCDTDINLSIFYKMNTLKEKLKTL
jgi:hypothetical protein